MAEGDTFDEMPDMFQPMIIVNDERMGNLTWEISPAIVSMFPPGTLEENLEALHTITRMYMGLVTAAFLCGDEEVANKYLTALQVAIKTFAQQLIEDIEGSHEPGE